MRTRCKSTRSFDSILDAVSADDDINAYVNLPARHLFAHSRQRPHPRRYGGAFYAVSPAPDGSVWGSLLGFPGAVVRLNPGSNPPETALAEVYEPPLDNPKAPAHGFSPRGMDIDRNGVVWAALASGHLASFDRRKCKGPLNGPTAMGQQCPEGWTLYPEPLPQFQGVSDSGSAESSYYTWVINSARSDWDRTSRSTRAINPRACWF